MLLVYAWPSDHQHILMIVPTPFGKAQHTGLPIFLRDLEDPMWPRQGNAIARLPVEFRQDRVIVIDEAETSIRYGRRGDRKQLVIEVFPFMGLDVFRMAAQQRDDRYALLGQRA